MPIQEENATFVCKLGGRLREIRKRAGLTLNSLSQRLAPGSKSYHHILQRLEKGKIKSPSINLIAQYLAGCGASFADIIDILNRATKVPLKTGTEGAALLTQATETLPEPLKTEVREVDRHLSKLKIEPIEKRLNRAKRMAQNRIIRTLLEDTLYQIITAPEAKEIEFEKLAGLCHLGRKLFSIFKRTRNNLARRTRLMEKLIRRAKYQDLPESGVSTVLEKINHLFQEMEENGIFEENFTWQKLPEDWLKPLLPAPVRAEKRIVLEREKGRIQREKERAGVGITIFLEMNRQLKVENLDHKTRGWVMEFINRLFKIAVELDSNPLEMERRFAELLSQSPDPDLAQKTLDLFKTTYPKYRQKAINSNVSES
ncbi:MAG: helix-turn-helix transcriptional regulator [candidate division WOR-3 bacterium]